MINENTHQGHRARMREKLFSAGVESFHDHELLEMFLFGSESRRNTNDTAHLLIKRFGTLRGVFTANPDALMEIEGVKRAAAAQIIAMGELMRRIDKECVDLPETFESREQIGEYLVDLYKFSSVEEMYMLMFDNGMRLIDCVLIAKGTVNYTPVDVRKIVKKAVLNDASGVVIAHNHPGGKLIASSADAVITRDIAVALNSVEIEVLDHILVAGNKYTSIMNTGYGIM